MYGESDELAILRAVCATPEDDTPRLGYADWCDDQADPLLRVHAAIIREQVKRARMTMETSDADYRACCSEERRLLLSICRWEGSDWCAGNALSMRLMGRTLGGTGYTRPERWDRGFPMVVTFDSVAAWERETGAHLADTLFPKPDSLYERVPLILSRVRGRRPWSSDPVGRAAADFRWWWSESRRAVAVERPGEVPRRVFAAFSRRNEFSRRPDAYETAWRAFTDAGRIMSGLTPRFKIDIEAEPATAGEREGAA